MKTATFFHLSRNPKNTVLVNLLWIISFPPDYFHTKDVECYCMSTWIYDKIGFTFVARERLMSFEIFWRIGVRFYYDCTFRQFYEMASVAAIVYSEICFWWKRNKQLQNHDVVHCGNRYWMLFPCCRLLTKLRSCTASKPQSCVRIWLNCYCPR